jgi:hypothetical protein
MYMPSHAGDSAASVIWSPRDIVVKSCWRWCCRGDLATAHVDVESCWQRCCRVMLAMALQLKVGLAVVGLRSR